MLIAYRQLLFFAYGGKTLAAIILKLLELPGAFTSVFDSREAALLTCPSFSKYLWPQARWLVWHVEFRASTQGALEKKRLTFARQPAEALGPKPGLRL